MTFVLEYLQHVGRIEGDFDVTGGGLFRLTYEGWQYYTELTRGARGSKRVFMAMPFKEAELARFVEEVFCPAVSQTGFELFRLDAEPEAGLIDNRLRVEIRRARFLIADLTHDNLGAYWEAGFAEGLGKPVIYTCEKGKETHFDTRQCQTVFWQLAEPAKAAEDLKATIRATLPGEALLEDPPG
jgi:hypothetical protein